jgi:hypothetical protein
MSRSNPTAFLERPCKKYLKWNGEEGADGGYFSYFDKDKNEDIKVLPGELTFLVLDHRLFSVTGFSKPLESFCFSNEVRTVKDKLVIRSFGNKGKGIKPETLLEGAYEDLKGEGGPIMRSNKTKELKYTRCVYIFWNGEICHLQLKGVNMQKWLEEIERSPAKIQRNWVEFVAAHEATSGKNTYQYAEFAFGDVPDAATDKAAMDADKIVQTYLKAYLAKNGSADKGDGGHNEEADDSNQERNESFDYRNWREFDMGGVKMGAQSLESLREFFYANEEGGVENDYQECLRAALAEYAKAGETWEQAKDPKGKFLSEYTFEELDGLAKLLREKAPMHGSRLKVEFALEFKRPKPSVEDQIPDVGQGAADPADYTDEEDDIPF